MPLMFAGSLCGMTVEIDGEQLLYVSSDLGHFS